ncbi:MAG TPA: lytic transglycosylase domain-containing protein [Streptosporangiaceae bacterium]|nr:lytic transglycosylase domain-containing protein [Streptosporangiaceae bacterium]
MSRIRTSFSKPTNLIAAIAASASAVAAATAAAAAVASSAPAPAPVAGSAGPASTAGAATGAVATATGGRPAIRLDAAHVSQEQAARKTARNMLHHFGWGTRQFPPLDKLWNRESSWNKYASNPYSGAYGIPQAVPGSKMASAGRDWRTNATTQVRWGLGYIKAVYGYPRRAWQHELAYGWY